MTVSIPIDRLVLPEPAIIHTLTQDHEGQTPGLAAIGHAEHAMLREKIGGHPITACLIAYRTDEGLKVIDYARDPALSILSIQRNSPTFTVRSGSVSPGLPLRQDDAGVRKIQAEAQSPEYRLLDAPLSLDERVAFLEREVRELRDELNTHIREHG